MRSTGHGRQTGTLPLARDASRRGPSRSFLCRLAPAQPPSSRGPVRASPDANLGAGGLGQGWSAAVSSRGGGDTCWPATRRRAPTLRPLLTGGRDWVGEQAKLVV